MSPPVSAADNALQGAIIAPTTGVCEARLVRGRVARNPGLRAPSPSFGLPPPGRQPACVRDTPHEHQLAGPNDHCLAGSNNHCLAGPGEYRLAGG